jgi:hypothetical protein
MRPRRVSWYTPKGDLHTLGNELQSSFSGIRHEWAVARKLRRRPRSAAAGGLEGGMRHIYLGIRANTPEMIGANLLIDRGDEIAILDSSATLGAALYRKVADSWQRTQMFVWRCRRTDGGQAALAEREAFLEEEHWVAANARMGSANELEYKVEMTHETLRLAVGFIRASKPDAKTPWPSALDDDRIKPTPGGLPAEMAFSPDKWATIGIS